MLDGEAKDPATVEAALSGWEGLLEKIASELYRMTSMLVGEGEASVALIEHVVTNLDFSCCRDHGEARHNSRLGPWWPRQSRSSPSATRMLLRAPDESASGPVSCIEDDDLEAAGVTQSELESMLDGPDNQLLRSWLESLEPPLRVIFVLRAIAGLSSVEVLAVLLAEHGGPAAETWTPDEVRSSFRQALCSLASQLIHLSVAK